MIWYDERLDVRRCVQNCCNRTKINNSSPFLILYIYYSKISRNLSSLQHVILLKMLRI